MARQDIVKVYGRPDCVQCKFTVKELDKKGISHEYLDIKECPDTKGLQQLPIVIAGNTFWGGFKPDKIRLLS